MALAGAVATAVRACQRSYNSQIAQILCQTSLLADQEV